ncbi:MAG: hypothetical protein QM811_06970 [Pirellulales bacterium]
MNLVIYGVPLSGLPSVAAPTLNTSTFSTGWEPDGVSGIGYFLIPGAVDGVTTFDIYIDGVWSGETIYESGFSLESLSYGSTYQIQVRLKASLTGVEGPATSQMSPALAFTPAYAQALTYKNALAAASPAVVLTAPQYTAVNDCFNSLQVENLLDDMIQLQPLFHGSAGANGVCMIGSGSAFSGGITHNSKSVTGNGTTGRLNSGSTPSTNGMTTSAAWWGYYSPSTVAAHTSKVMGCVGSNPSTIVMQGGINFTGLGDYCDFNESNRASSGTSSGAPGLYTYHRYSSSGVRVHPLRRHAERTGEQDRRKRDIQPASAADLLSGEKQ